MRILDTLRFAVANLFRHKLRSALTMIGVAIGAGAIVVMLSLAEGLKSELVQVLSSGDNLQTLQVMPMKVEINFNPRKAKQPFRIYKDDDIEKLRAIPGVKAAWPNLQLFPLCERDDKSESTPPNGVSVERAESTPLHAVPIEAVSPYLRESLIAGSWWKGDGPEVVVPLWFLRKRVPDDDTGKVKPKDPTREEAAAAVGTSITLVFSRRDPEVPPSLAVEGPDDKGRRRVRCRISGVYDSKKAGGTERGLWIPLAFGKSLQGLAEAQLAFTDAGPVMLKAGEYSMVFVRANSVGELPRVKERVEALGYPTFTVQEAILMVDKATIVLQAALSCVGGIALLVAFFGIVNTMIMAILERTREIGMLKALGARNRDIRRIFVLEAAGIGLSGALTGALGGWVIGLLTNLIAFKAYFEERGFEQIDLFLTRAWFVSGSVGFGVFVACAAGLLPAIRAARLDPVTALRNE
ncbi:MAG: ABC transporter permease [Planctomycetota bacterium]